jgi:hypothetical protein
MADDEALAAGALEHLPQLIAGVVLVIQGAEALLAEGAVPHHAAPVPVDAKGSSVNSRPGQTIAPKHHNPRKAKEAPPVSELNPMVTRDA